MALSYINNKEIKFGSSKPLNGVYTPGSPTREYEPLDSLGIYLNSGIPLSYGVENGRYMSMSDEFAATSQGNSYSFNQLFAAQMMLGFKLHDRFIACDTEHKIIGTEPLLHKAYLAEITEKTLDYFKIKIYGDKTRTFCIRMSSSEVPTSYVDLTNSFDENGLNLTQTDRLSFLSYYRFYPLTVRALSTRVVETLGKGCYFLPSSESSGELSGDILSKFNAFISSDGNTLTSLGDTAFAYMGDVVYVVNYGGKITESLLDTKVDYTDLLTYEEIMASTPPVDLDLAVAKASALKTIATQIDGIVVKNIEVTGEKTIKLTSTEGSVFMGILLARAYMAGHYSMYFLSGYAHGLSRYNSVLINTNNNPITSIDDSSVADTISITTENSLVNLSFLWFSGGNAFTYEII